MRRTLFVPLLLAACTSVTDAPRPEVLTTELEAPGPLVRRLTVTLLRPARLEVRYGSADDHRLRVTSPRATTHVVHLARLRPGRAHSFQVVDTEVSGTFETDPLPADLADVRLAAEGSLSAALVLLHLFDPDGFMGYAAVDGAGEVVGYWRTVDFPFGMTRRRNGDFVFMDKARGLVQVTPWGEEVRTLAQDVAAREMHHDLTTTPDDRILFIAFDTRRPGGGAPVKGEALWAWDPESGEVVRRWSSWDHLSPQDDRGPRFGEEWLHANSVQVGPRGNVVLSLHYLNQVVSIAPDGGMEWRLGGPGASWELAEEDRFSGQHTAREIETDRILLFDNHLDQGGPSRVLELDVSGPRPRRVWSWTPPNGNFATAVGSARRLPGGGTLVGFGMSTGLAGSTGPVEVYEVDPRGEVAWHLAVDGPTVMFRAEPLGSLAGEETLDGSGR